VRSGDSTSIFGARSLLGITAGPLSLSAPYSTAVLAAGDAASIYGANSFIVKPVQFDQYLPRIGGVVSYWMTLNELPRAV